MVEAAALAAEAAALKVPARRRPRGSGRGAVFVLALIALLVVVGPWVSPYAYDAQSLELLGRPRPPSLAHWLGTDELGRDGLTRLLYGGRISLAVGFASALAATLLGAAVGALAGYFGGWVDQALMRFTDVVLSIPALPLVLVVVGLLRPAPAVLVGVISGLIWTAPARLLRTEVRGLKSREFILAARVLGAGPVRIILRHLLPNAFGSIAVSATLSVGGAILLESALSFLGFGVQPPSPTWGNLLNQAEPWLVSAPWLSLPPGFLIFATVLSVNFLGEALKVRVQGEP